MDMSLVILLAAFGGTAAAAWVVIEMFVAAKSRAEERLDEMRDPTLRKDREASESEVTKKKGTKEAFGRLVEKAQALAKPLQPKNESEEGKLKVKLATAGFRSENASNVFLGMKIACLIGGGFLGGGTVMLVSGVNQDSLLKFLASGCVSG